MDFVANELSDDKKKILAEQDQEKLAKKLEKFKSKELKEAGKGNLEKTVVSVWLSMRHKMLAEQQRRCEAEMSEANDNMAELRRQLVPEISEFTGDEYRKMFPGDEFPVRQLTVSLKGTGRHSLSYYAKKYPYMMKKSISGKFNGFLEDKLYLFPLESSIDSESVTDDIFVATRLLLKSEKGTVPDCIIGSKNEEGYELLRIMIMTSGEYQGMNAEVTTLTDCWEKGADKRDGVFFSAGHGEDEQTDMLTYVFDGDRWSNRPPFNPRYITYDGCQQLVPERIINKEPLRYKWSENNELELYEGGTLNLIAVASTNGISALIKSDGIDDLEVPASGLVGFKIVDGNPHDLLVLYYDGPKSEIAEIYAVSWSGPFSYSLNGTGIDGSFKWEKVGFVPDSNVGKIIPIRSYSNPGRNGWYEEITSEDETYKVNGILKKSEEPVQWSLVQQQLDMKLPDSVSVDEIKRNIQQFCNNVLGADSIPRDLNYVQTDRLLRGAAFHVPSGAIIEGWAPIAGNVLVQIVSKPEKEEFSDKIVQHRYLALYSPSGELKDAVWIGKFFPEEELNSKDLSNEHTAFFWMSPRRFKILAYKMVESDGERFNGINELEYIVADDRFVVTSYLWNIGECTTYSVWPYMEPVSFLKRFPLKSTPWDLWYNYARHTDGEYAESLYVSDLHALYSRNPEMFLKKAAKVFSAKESKEENMAYQFFNQGMFLDYYPDELKPIQENIKKYLTPVESSGLLRVIVQ